MVLHAGGRCTRQLATPALPCAGLGGSGPPPKEPLAAHPGAVFWAPHSRVTRGLGGHVPHDICKSIPWPHAEGGKRQPIGTRDHRTRWWQVAPVPCGQLRTLALRGMPAYVREVGWPQGTRGQWRGRQGGRQHPSPPGNPSVLGRMDLLLGEASFLKCISSSRSLTIEALIKVEINFCQRASRAHSVLFLQEPLSLARSHRKRGREGGSSAEKNLKRQSQFAMPGANGCWKTSCIHVAMIPTLRTGTQTARGAGRGTRWGLVRQRLSWDPA